MAPLKNRKHQLFVDGYLAHFNASKAAVDAGYSPATSSAIGYNLLQRPEIKEAVEAGYAERRAVITGIPIEVLLNELIQIAMVNIETDTTTKVKYPDKLKALDILMKYHMEKEASKGMSNANIEAYIKALQGNMSDVWSDTDGTKE